MFDVGLDVFATVGECRQWVIPDVDAGEQVFAEASGSNFVA